MKISVLLYLCGREDDAWLEKALVSAGIRVCRTGNLSKLHTILSSRSFDAVFVSRKTLVCHCMNATRHLWQMRSPHVIIDWEARSDGAVDWTVHRVPASVTGIADMPEREEKLAALAKILSGTNLRHEMAELEPEPAAELAPNPKSAIGTRQPNPTPAKSVPVPPEVTGSLHAKLALILETIAETGEAGIDVATLALRIWGAENRDRKKDIQIYVSKLRKALSRHSADRFSLPFENRRYYLRDATSESRQSEGWQA